MKPEKLLITASDILIERGKQRDSPKGERSMLPAIQAFNSITKHNISESQGWLFMVLLKCVRTQSGEYSSDNFIDMVAYAALANEAAFSEHTHDDPGLTVTKCKHKGGTNELRNK